MSEQNEQKPVGIAIPVRWTSPEQASTVYANQLIVTHGGGEFYLVFGEAVPPLILDPEKQPLPDFVEIKALIKIAVEPEHMLRFAKAIQANVANYLSRRPEQQGD